MKKWNVLNSMGMTIMELSVGLGLVGIIGAYVASQNSLIVKSIRTGKNKQEIIEMHQSVINSFSDTASCEASLGSLGILGDDAQMQQFFMGAQNLNIDSLNLPELFNYKSQNYQISQIQTIGHGAGEFTLQFVYENLNARNDLERYVNRNVPLILNRNSDGWHCFGVEDQEADVSSLRAFCESLGGSYDESSGDCPGVVNPDTLASFCESIEGNWNPSARECSGVPGEADLGRLCGALGGTSESTDVLGETRGNRNCTNFPHHMRRRNLCAALGGTVAQGGGQFGAGAGENNNFYYGDEANASVESCIGVEDHHLANLCGQLGGTWNKGSGICVGALDTDFNNVCDSVGGVYNTSTGECDMHSQLSQLCASIGGTYSESNKTCNGVDDTFFAGACSSLGGDYVSDSGACNGVLDKELENFCTAMNGSYNPGSRECEGVFTTFQNICDDMIGDSGVQGGFNETTKACDNLEAGWYTRVCNSLPDHHYDAESKSCKLDYDLICGPNETLIGSSGHPECINLATLADDFGFVKGVGGSCGAMNFVTGVSPSGYECGPSDRFFYMASDNSSSTGSGSCSGNTSAIGFSYSIPKNGDMSMGALQCSGSGAANSANIGKAAEASSRTASLAGTPTATFEQIDDEVEKIPGCTIKIPHQYTDYFHGFKDLRCEGGAVATSIDIKRLSSTSLPVTVEPMSEDDDCPSTINVEVKKYQMKLECSKYTFSASSGTYTAMGYYSSGSNVSGENGTITFLNRLFYRAQNYKEKLYSSIRKGTRGFRAYAQNTGCFDEWGAPVPCDGFGLIDDPSNGQITNDPYGTGGVVPQNNGTLPIEPIEPVNNPPEPSGPTGPSGGGTGNMVVQPEYDGNWVCNGSGAAKQGCTPGYDYLYEQEIPCNPDTVNRTGNYCIEPNNQGYLCSTTVDGIEELHCTVGYDAYGVSYGCPDVQQQANSSCVVDSGGSSSGGGATSPTPTGGSGSGSGSGTGGSSGLGGVLGTGTTVTNPNTPVHTNPTNTFNPFNPDGTLKQKPIHGSSTVANCSKQDQFVTGVIREGNKLSPVCSVILLNSGDRGAGTCE